LKDDFALLAPHLKTNQPSHFVVEERDEGAISLLEAETGQVKRLLTVGWALGLLNPDALAAVDSEFAKLTLEAIS